MDVPDWLNTDLAEKTPPRRRDFAICKLCGGSWPVGDDPHVDSSTPAATFARSVPAEDCPSCSGIAQFHPTIFAWVVRVVLFQKALILRGDFGAKDEETK